MNMNLKNKCFLPIKCNPNASLRLICFPYAGGSASIYANWGKFLSDDIEIIAAQPPGRSMRLGEDAHTEMADIIDEFMESAELFDDKPYIFFGHSLGSRMAFALALRIQSQNLPLPQHIIASGSCAPHLPFDREITHNLPPDEFKDKLEDLNGTPKEILQNQELMDILIPLLRADFKIAETYQSEKIAINCPMTILGGTEDSGIPLEKLNAWGELSIFPVNISIITGDHFFINTNTAVVINRVSKVADTVLKHLNQRLKTTY
ncbi:MAG: medium-chain acyl-[acyl-carrier-protein] hydrolase [Francisellaceae bacterium]|jgi:medium-chain acyl-[acyl-carrier-protein] hydrolase